MSQYLFVYGLLRHKVDHPMAEFLRGNARFIGEGYIDGQLYDTGSYPAALLNEGKKSRIIGDIFELKG